MADTDIMKAIEIIDAKIASLQEARDRLASAFGVEARSVKVAPSPRATTPAPSTQSDNGHGPKGRKEQLAQFLLEHGPTSRTDILNNSGLPEGTLSYCLNDKRFFVQLDDGQWNLTDFSKRGLEMKSAADGGAAQDSDD